MTKVQEYLHNKKIKELGLPKVWVVKSTPEGVELPIERQVVEIKLNISTRHYNSKEIQLNRYVLDKVSYPFEVDIENDSLSSSDYGYGSGFGDLWAWTYYTTLSKEDADEYYVKELKRITSKYLNRPLKEAINTLIEADTAKKLVSDYAKNQYTERFKDTKHPYNAFHYYKSFDMLSPTNLRINFVYGAGDMEFNDSFIVEID
jgi:hypothetical protein